MRVVIQRVSSASVSITGNRVGAIENGLLVLAGFEDADTKDDLNWMAKKILNLRIFNDEQGKMNLSLLDVEGDILLVSQFTLHASTAKGNRPSYIKAANPVIAIPLYNSFHEILEGALGKAVPTGEFGADMQVSLVNDGPVTISIDSKVKA